MQRERIRKIHITVPSQGILNMSIVVAALYEFKKIDDPKKLQNKLKNFCHSIGLKGTLLVAHEGINGTVCGNRQCIDQIRSFLIDDCMFQQLEYKESFADESVFCRMKVKLKKEIVTMGVENIDPIIDTGIYISPKDWNELIQDPNTIVIDTRNDYEYQLGAFKNSVNPNTQTFKEFPKYVQDHLLSCKDKTIAMYCTGGIRCEKSTSYLKHLGFQNIYHLKGGILKYLENVADHHNLFEGDCFVFDERIAVGHGLALTDYKKCYGCRETLSDDDLHSDLYEEGVKCPHCANLYDDQHFNRARERHKQVILAKEKGIQHIGDQRPHHM